MTKHALLLPILLGALLTSGIATAKEVDALMARARQAESKGDVVSAVRLTEAALIQEPVRTEPYVLLGDLYAGQSQPDHARFYYEQALTIDPQNVPAQAGIGRLESNPKTSADTALDKQ